MATHISLNFQSNLPWWIRASYSIFTRYARLAYAITNNLWAESEAYISNYVVYVDDRRGSLYRRHALRARVSAVTQIGARELARRARTRTRILTLLRCSSVWCVDINAHGSLLRRGVHTRALNRPRVFAVVVIIVVYSGMTVGGYG